MDERSRRRRRRSAHARGQPALRGPRLGDRASSPACVGAGAARSCCRREPTGDTPPNHPDYDRLWSAVDVDLGMVPIVHVGLSPAIYHPAWANTDNPALIRVISVLQPAPAGPGVPERHGARRRLRAPPAADRSCSPSTASTGSRRPRSAWTRWRRPGLSPLLLGDDYKLPMTPAEYVAPQRPGDAAARRRTSRRCRPFECLPDSADLLLRLPALRGQRRPDRPLRERRWQRSRRETEGRRSSATTSPSASPGWATRSPRGRRTREDADMIDPGAVGNLVTSWWFDYDQGNFTAWPPLLHRRRTLLLPQRLRADRLRGVHPGRRLGSRRAARVAGGPPPQQPVPAAPQRPQRARHPRPDGEADFRSYLFVTQIVDGAVTNLSTGIVLGTAREEDGVLRIADLRVILDTSDSEVFGPGARPIPA